VELCCKKEAELLASFTLGQYLQTNHYVQVRMYVCMYVYKCECVHACSQVCMCISIHVSLFKCARVCMFV